MSQAYWTAAFPGSRKRLKDLLVQEDPRPKNARPWQELKAKIMLALGPGKAS